MQQPFNAPLLEPFATPFETAPFDKIRQEDFEPAIAEAINRARQEIDAIVNHSDDPDFDNTIAALERAGKKLNVITEIFFNLCSAETTDYLEKVQERVSPALAAFTNDIHLNDDLFQKVRSVYQQQSGKLSSDEGQRLLEKTYKAFVRNGALLTAEQKERLRAIDSALAALQVKFSQNVLQETNDYLLHLTDPSDLDGLPPSICEAAKAEAEQRHLQGWAFTLQFPSYVPFLKYATKRDLRKEIYTASAQKAFRDNGANNEPVIREIAALRDERAKLLGYSSHAAFVLEERMAASPETVNDFLNDLLHKAADFGRQDVNRLGQLAAADGIDTMMPYDHAFYAEKLREQQFDLSEERLKPYFPLKNVLHAAFDAAQRLYGLKFRERNDIPKYHEEVVVYEVLENDAHKAILYTDWHPRKGKRAGAWMTSFRGQYKEDSKNYRPHISIVCNFSRPNGDTPSLLTFSEVTTLFHEFGHALHGMLADTVYESLSGTNVYWDFVELPSQFMENYCYDRAFLKSFARHYQSNETLPDEEIEKIVASANFMEGYQTLRQISFGLLDMAFHTGQLTNESIEAFENRFMKPTRLYPHLPGTAMSPSFSHIFSGGYAAGYYSYKWSEVLDADAFAYFKENGIFDPQTAAKFKTLLSKGGTEDPMQLYVAFRGRKPTADALLERAGLSTEPAKS